MSIALKGGHLNIAVFIQKCLAYKKMASSKLALTQLRTAVKQLSDPPPADAWARFLRQPKKRQFIEWLDDCIADSRACYLVTLSPGLVRFLWFSRALSYSRFWFPLLSFRLCRLCSGPQIQKSRCVHCANSSIIGMAFGKSGGASFPFLFTISRRRVNASAALPRLWAGLNASHLRIVSLTRRSRYLVLNRNQSITDKGARWSASSPRIIGSLWPSKKVGSKSKLRRKTSGRRWTRRPPHPGR